MITIRNLFCGNVEATFRGNNAMVEIGVLDKAEAEQLGRDLIETVHELYDFVGHPQAEAIAKVIDELDYPQEKQS